MTYILHFPVTGSAPDADKTRDLTILVSAAIAIVALVVGIFAISPSHERGGDGIESMVAIPF
jgi:hypothetical protein